MPSNFSGFLSSKTFEVRSRDKSFFVHSRFLAAQSESLRNSITGAEERIDLLEWDGDTVGRFVEFLYNGVYYVSKPGEDSEDGGDGGDGGDGEERLELDGAMTPDTVQSLVDREELEPINVLLAHAKVYALAQYKDVEALRVVALERVREELLGIRGYMFVEGSTLMLNVIELLDYVYSHTDSPKRSEEPVGDLGSTFARSEGPMRDLVSRFVAVNFEKLMDQKEMGILLDKGGDLAVDLREKVARTLYNERKRLSDVELVAQDWKDQFATLEEKAQQLEAKVQELEIANAEQLRQSEAAHTAEVQQLEATNAEKTRQLEAKIQELEGANAKIRQLEIANAEKLGQLEVIDTERQSWAANVAKVRQLEATNTERLHKILTLEDSIAAMKREDQWKEPIFSVSGWEFSPHTLFCIATVLVMLILVASPSQKPPPPAQTVPDPEPKGFFENLFG